MVPRSRRLLLRQALWVAGSIALVNRGRAQGLADFAGGPPPCLPDEKATPATPEGPEFKPGAPRRSSLREPGLPGTTLTLQGTISGLTCGPIKGARVDFWQADVNGVYDRAGFRLRGYQLTDGNGAYALETIEPGASRGRAPRLHLKVVPPGKAPFTTQLFFPNHPLNARDPQFRPELVLTMSGARARGSPRSARFNIVLNL
jgi:protocatechuate 3,4-dioxygenase beta subunit